MNIIRFKNNPLIAPSDITPYHDGYEVIGVFNAGVAKLNDQTILLLRVAERPLSEDAKVIYAPVYNHTKKTVEKVEYNLNDNRFDFSDPRTIQINDGSKRLTHLTSLSYVRLARSYDGETFVVDDEPFLYPYDKYTSFGVEDPRCTQIEDEFVITYTSVSEYGIGVSAVKTKDFENTEFIGNIFAPENKDVLIFPEKIQGKYYALHRPSLSSLGGLNIWLASSPDLLSWGNHKFLIGTREDSWESQRIGGGLPPIKTEKGWLIIYHGANEKSRYCMGAALLDLNSPDKVIARAKQPIMEPTVEYEQKGFFGDVVFGCGGVVEGDTLTMYYGASDTTTAGCKLSMREILNQLEEEL